MGSVEQVFRSLEHKSILKNKKQNNFPSKHEIEMNFNF